MRRDLIGRAMPRTTRCDLQKEGMESSECLYRKNQHQFPNKAANKSQSYYKFPGKNSFLYEGVPDETDRKQGKEAKKSPTYLYKKKNHLFPKRVASTPPRYQEVIHNNLEHSKTGNGRQGKQLVNPPKHLHIKNNHVFPKCTSNTTPMHEEILNQNSGSVMGECGSHVDEVNVSPILYHDENYLILDSAGNPKTIKNTPTKQERILCGELENLILNLKEFVKSRDDFLAAYPEWKKCRIENIQSVSDLANELDRVHEICNITKATGNVLGIGSGVAGLVSLFVPSAFDACQIASKTCSFISNATSVGATVAEWIVFSNILKKAKMLAVKDQQELQKLLKLQEKSQSLMTAAQRFCNFDIIGPVFNALNSIIPKIITVSDNIEIFVNDVMKQVLNLVGRPLSPNTITKITFLCKTIYNGGNMLPSIRKVYEYINKSPTLLSTACVFVRIRCDIRSSLKCRRLTGKSGAISPGDKVVYAGFEAMKIAAHIVELGHISEDLKNGSLSEYSNRLRDVQSELKDELNFLEKINKEILMNL